MAPIHDRHNESHEYANKYFIYVIYLYIFLGGVQWKAPSSSQPEIAAYDARSSKTTFTCFFDYGGIFHQESMNRDIGESTLWQFGSRQKKRRFKTSQPTALSRKKADLRPKWINCGNNVPKMMHSASTISTPPYPPKLAPCDFWLPAGKKLPGKEFFLIFLIPSLAGKMAEEMWCKRMGFSTRSRTHLSGWGPRRKDRDRGQQYSGSCSQTESPTKTGNPTSH